MYFYRFVVQVIVMAFQDCDPKEYVRLPLHFQLDRKTEMQSDDILFKILPSYGWVRL